MPYAVTLVSPHLVDLSGALTRRHVSNLVSLRDGFRVKSDFLLETFLGVVEDVLNELSSVGNGDVGQRCSFGQDKRSQIGAIRLLQAISNFPPAESFNLP